MHLSKSTNCNMLLQVTVPGDEDKLVVDFKDIDGETKSDKPLKDVKVTFTSTGPVVLTSDKLHICHKPVTTTVAPTTTTTRMSILK